MMKNNHVDRIPLVFLTGLAAGGAAALLLAPQSGARTRRQIARKTEDIQSYAQDLGEELIEKGRGLVERGQAISSSRAERFWTRH
jgi:gas vesicle protein